MAMLPQKQSQTGRGFTVLTLKLYIQNNEKTNKKLHCTKKKCRDVSSRDISRPSRLKNSYSPKLYHYEKII